MVDHEQDVDAKVGWLVGRSIGRAGERSRYVAIAELRPVENRDGKPQDGGVLGKLSHKSHKELKAAAVKRRRNAKCAAAHKINTSTDRSPAQHEKGRCWRDGPVTHTFQNG